MTDVNNSPGKLQISPELVLDKCLLECDISCLLSFVSFRFMISQLKTWKTWVKLVEEILVVSIKCSISKQTLSWLSRYQSNVTLS